MAIWFANKRSTIECGVYILIYARANKGSINEPTSFFILHFLFPNENQFEKKREKRKMKKKTKRVMQMKTMRDVTTCHIGNAMRWIKGEIVRETSLIRILAARPAICCRMPGGCQRCFPFFSLFFSRIKLMEFCIKWPPFRQPIRAFRPLIIRFGYESYLSLIHLIRQEIFFFFFNFCILWTLCLAHFIRVLKNYETAWIRDTLFYHTFNSKIYLGMRKIKNKSHLLFFLNKK